ncbi:hypothetical protein [Scytonema sp. NUACC21]
MCVIIKSGILPRGIKQLHQKSAVANRTVAEVFKPGEVVIGLMGVTPKSLLYRYKTQALNFEKSVPIVFYQSGTRSLGCQPYAF